MRPTRSSAIPRSGRSTTNSDLAGRSTSSGSAPVARGRIRSKAANEHFRYQTVSPERPREHVRQQRSLQRLLPAVLRWRRGRPDAFTTTRARRRVARRGQDVEGDAEISLEDAFPRFDAHGRSELVGRSASRRGQDPSRDPRWRPGAGHGQGSSGRGGGPRGDLFIRVHIRPHPAFTRSGDDLKTSGCRCHWPRPSRAHRRSSTLRGTTGAALDFGRHAERGPAEAPRTGDAAPQGGWRGRPDRHRGRAAATSDAGAAARLG